MYSLHHFRTYLIVVFSITIWTHALHAAPGILVINGDTTLGGNSLASFEVFGTTPGTGHDQINITGNLIIDPARAELITDLNTFIPSYGDVFQIITYGSRTGVFDRIDGVFPAHALALAPVYDFPGSANPVLANTPFAPAPNSLTLFTTLPGDANLDLKVEDRDLSLLLTNFGMSNASWLDGDFTGDTRVDDDDLSLLLTNFGNTATIGQTPAVPTTTISAVPEPTTLAILSLGGLLLARRRVRK